MKTRVRNPLCPTLSQSLLFSFWVPFEVGASSRYHGKVLTILSVFCFVLIILYSLYLKYDSHFLRFASRLAGSMDELSSCYPQSASDKRNESKHLNVIYINYNGNVMKSGIACWLLLLLLLLRRFGRELHDIDSHQEVHHCVIVLVHGEQLSDLHASASGCSPSPCFPHTFPDGLLQVSPSAAVEDKMLMRLVCHPASPAKLPAIDVVSVPEPFQVRTHWLLSRFDSVELGFQWFRTVHWDGSFAPSVAF